MTTNNQNKIEILYTAYLYQARALALTVPNVTFDTRVMQDTILNSILPMTFQEIAIGEGFVQGRVATADMAEVELIKVMMQVVSATKFFFNNAVTELGKVGIMITPEQLLGMTLHQAIKFSEGKDPEEVFKQRNIVAGAYHVVDNALGKTVDVTVDAVRDGLGWLGRKLVKWTEKK